MLRTHALMAVTVLALSACGLGCGGGEEAPAIFVLDDGGVAADPGDALPPGEDPIGGEPSLPVPPEDPGPYGPLE